MRKHLRTLLAVCIVFALAAPALAGEALDEEIEVLGIESDPAWKGQIELGANYSSGNTDKRGFIFGARAKRETAEDEFEARFDAIYSEDDGERSVNEQILAFRYDIELEDPWYAFALLSFERDEHEEIDLRAIFAPGVGYWLTKEEDLQARLEAGPSALYEDYRTEEGETWELEFRVGFWGQMKVFDSATLTQDLQYFPTLTDTPEYRLVSETTFAQPLSESWFLKLAVLWFYDSAPAEHVDRQDLKVLISLVYEF